MEGRRRPEVGGRIAGFCPALAGLCGFVWRVNISGSHTFSVLCRSSQIKTKKKVKRKLNTSNVKTSAGWPRCVSGLGLSGGTLVTTSEIRQPRKSGPREMST